VNQTTELTKPRPGGGAELNGAGQAASTTAPVRKLWRPPWLLVLGGIVIAWLIYFVLPHGYLTLNQRLSGVVLLKNVVLHYPIVIVHVASTTIALLLAPLQMWSWIRRRFPKPHRIIGRIFLFAVIFASPSGIALAVLADMRDGARIGTYMAGFLTGNVIFALLWLGFTVRAFLAARKHQYAKHRRLMVYAFALTLAIMWTRPFRVMAEDGTVPYWTMASFLENMGWFPWLTNLAIAHWWLNRTRKRPLVLPANVSSEPES
jgi:Predicted membrane protein (DUF2306)